MGCNSEYMEPNSRERELSHIACFLDEIKGKKTIDHGLGFHPMVYCKDLSKRAADGMVKKLCSWCKENDVTEKSLELQLWWRDHQKQDEIRVKKEALNIEKSKQKQKAIKKLTPYERKLLGL